MDGWKRKWYRERQREFVWYRIQSREEDKKHILEYKFFLLKECMCVFVCVRCTRKSSILRTSSITKSTLVRSMCDLCVLFLSFFFRSFFIRCERSNLLNSFDLMIIMFLWILLQREKRWTMCVCDHSKGEREREWIMISFRWNSPTILNRATSVIK